MSEHLENNTLYYPRKMRTGWCVAHEVTAAGVIIEKYGIHCQTYAEAFRRAEVMNQKQQPEKEQPREQQPGKVGDSQPKAEGGKAS